MRTEATWKSGCRNNARPHRTRLQTDDGRFNDTWDGENRATRFERVSGAPAAAQVRVDLEYDSQSRRIQKIVSTNNGSLWIGISTNRYLYDGWNLVAVLNHANNLVQSFAWGSDLSGSPQGAGGVGGLLSLTVASGTLAGTYFYAHDGNGNVLATVNAADGSLAARYDYGPFGEPIRASGPLAQANPFQFSTKFCDAETGLLYYGYRYCDPGTGRWLNRDPIGEESDRTLYPMCGSDPLNGVDVLGLQSEPNNPPRIGGPNNNGDWWWSNPDGSRNYGESPRHYPRFAPNPRVPPVPPFSNPRNPSAPPLSSPSQPLPGGDPASALADLLQDAANAFQAAMLRDSYEAAYAKGLADCKRSNPAGCPGCCKIAIYHIIGKWDSYNSWIPGGGNFSRDTCSKVKSDYENASASASPELRRWGPPGLYRRIVDFLNDKDSKWIPYDDQFDNTVYVKM